MPTTMIRPMNDETLNVVRVINSARKTPEVERTADERIAMGAEKDRNSKSSTRKIKTSASSKDDDKIVKRFLLLLRKCRRTPRGSKTAASSSLTAFCTAATPVPKSTPSKPRRHFHIALEIVAENLGLAGQFLHVGHGAKGGSASI